MDSHLLGSAPPNERRHFFKALAKGITGIARRLPGPVGLGATLAHRALGGNGRPAAPGVAMQRLQTGGQVTVHRRSPFQVGPLDFGRETTVTRFQQQGQPTQKERAKATAAQIGLACPQGFRPNQSDYFLKDGTFVAAGTRCVKIRRRNPLNPRAASRAVSRIQGAKRAVGLINRISIRKKC